jgi:hypothetical protein
MRKEEVKAFFTKLWEVRFIVVGTMIVTGILDLVGITSADLGLGFILGFCFLVVNFLVGYFKK